MSIVGIYGPRGSLKSTFPFTAPGFSKIFDLEQGTHRVTWRFPDTSKYNIWKPKLVTEKDELIKAFKINKHNPVYIGAREVYEDLIQHYVEACFNPLVINIVMDTGKELWECICNSFLQELQEAIVAQNLRIEESNSTKGAAKQAFKEQRQRLSEVEYREPNTRIKRFFATARSRQKNLFLIHHERPVREKRYNPETRKQENMVIPGKFEIDGFNATERFCDWVIETGEDEDNPKNKWGVIRKSPIGPELLGVKLQTQVDSIMGYDFTTLEKLVGKLDRKVLTV